MHSANAGDVHSLLQRVPRLQMLAVFESAARLGSFTAAAADLGMTQPAVSRRIADLERAIGCDLFDRTGNRVSLNDPGREFLTAVQAAFARIDESLNELGAEASTFRLAANPGFAQQWLLPNLDALQRFIGEAELRLRLFDRDGELAGERFDAAIHLTAIRGAPAGSRILFEERVMPVASADYAADHGLDSGSPAERLVEAPKLHLDSRDRRWATWSTWFDGHDVAWRRQRARLSYNNYAVVMAEVLQSAGVALAWRGLVEPLLESGALVQVGPELHRPGMAHLVVPGGAVDPLVIDQLVDWLSDLLDLETNRGRRPGDEYSDRL